TAGDGDENARPATEGAVPGLAPAVANDGPDAGEPAFGAASSDGDANAGDASTATAAPPRETVTLACGPSASCWRLPVTGCSEPVVSFWPRAVAAVSNAFSSSRYPIV